MDGKHAGVYTIESGIVRVSYFGGGRKATQIGHSSPETIARMLLRELVVEAHRR